MYCKASEAFLIGEREREREREERRRKGEKRMASFLKCYYQALLYAIKPALSKYYIIIINTIQRLYKVNKQLSQITTYDQNKK